MIQVCLLWNALWVITCIYFFFWYMPMVDTAQPKSMWPFPECTHLWKDFQNPLSKYKFYQWLHFLSAISLLPTLGIFCLFILVILMALSWHGIMSLIWILWANGVIQDFALAVVMWPSALMQSSLSLITLTDLQNSKLLFPWVTFQMYVLQIPSPTV